MEDAFEQAVEDLAALSAMISSARARAMVAAATVDLEGPRAG